MAFGNGFYARKKHTRILIFCLVSCAISMLTIFIWASFAEIPNEILTAHSHRHHQNSLNRDHDQDTLDEHIAAFPEQGIITDQVNARSKQIKVAVLAVDDNMASVENFLISAKNRFIPLDQFDRPVINVTYFIFVKTVEFLLRYEDNRPPDVVFVLVYTAPGEYNPCRVYLENADYHGYFDDAQFDYALSFDGRMEIARATKIGEELLGDRVAAIHPAFQSFSDKKLLPYNRENDSCAFVDYGAEGDNYFAADFFGGRPSLTKQLCKTVSTCQYSLAADPLPLHQPFNRFLLENPPSLVLGDTFLHATSYHDHVMPPGVIFKDKRVTERPLPSQQYPAAFDLTFFGQREKNTQKLTASLRLNYARMLAAGSKEGENLKVLKGAASLLYLSIATRRLFYSHWSGRLLGAGEVFHNVIDDGLKTEQLLDKVADTNGAAVELDDGGQALTDASFARSLHNVTSLIVTENRGHSLLQPMFADTGYIEALLEAMPSDLPEYTSNIDLAVYLSAALRVLFGRLSQEAELLLNDESLPTKLSGVNNKAEWADAAKIGVQIRGCLPEERENCSRVAASQISCFAEKLHEILRFRLGQSPRLIFVTSNLGELATREVRKHLEKLLEESDDTRVTVFDTYQMTLPAESWRPFVDWTLLTRMDWLVISRSHFGETASLFSLKPTEQYDHRTDSSSLCRFDWYNQDTTHLDSVY